MTDAVVKRLYRCLVDAVRESRPDGARHGPLTVAEIYQDLVPYRAVRDALGIGLNADYEHAVLRLLAGVGDFVRIEPAEAQQELRRELESDSPNVALFRKFAACDVRVRVPADAGADADTGADADADAGAGAAADEASSAAPAPNGAVAPSPTGDGRVTEAAERESVPRPESKSEPKPKSERTSEPKSEPKSERTPEPKSERTPASGAAVDRLPGVQRSTEPAARGDTCAFCDEALPTGRAVRYCPFCGADRRRRPCPACGESLESEWRYCIACGAAAAGD